MYNIRRQVIAGFAFASVASLGLGGFVLSPPSEPAAQSEVQSIDAPLAPQHGAPSAVDHGHDVFQPGYLEGRVVVYKPGAPVPGAPVSSLYQVRYPDGWEKLTARPLCDYCDHAQNGEDAADYHDHILTPPDRRANAKGTVTWHVFDVVPAYTGDARHDADVSAAIARKLPVQSADEVKQLANKRLPDGTPLVRIVDSGVEFGGPITSRY